MTDYTELVARLRGLLQFYEPDNYITISHGTVRRSVDAIEALSAHTAQPNVEMLKREIHNLKRHIEDYCQPTAAPVSEQDKKDAERYRLWRAIKVSAMIPGPLFMADTEDKVDAAIDAAIAGKEKP